MVLIALTSFLVIETIIIFVLIDDQVRTPDLLVNAVEYKSRLQRIQGPDTSYFKLLYVRPRVGELSPFQMPVFNSQYMLYSEQLHQNLAITFDRPNYSACITPDAPVTNEIAKRLHMPESSLHCMKGRNTTSPR